MIIHRVKAGEKTLPDQQDQESIEESRIVCRAQLKPLSQVPAKGTPFVEAEALRYARRLSKAHKTIGGTQLVDIRVQAPEFVEVLLGAPPDLLLGGLLQASTRNRQLAAELVQQGSNERFTIRWRHTGQQRRQLEQQTYASDLNLANRAWQESHVKLALEMLDRQRPSPGREDLRGFEWYLLERLCQQHLRQLRPGGEAVTAVAFAPNGHALAAASQDGTVTLWDPATWESRPLGDGGAAVGAIAFSHDSRWLATGSEDGIVRLWDVAAGVVASTLTGHLDVISAVAFAPDDRILAVATGRIGKGHSDLRIWDLERGCDRGVLWRLDGWPIGTLAFTPDGRTLIGGGVDHIIRLWEVSTGTMECLPERESSVNRLAVSPDGTTLATAIGSWNDPGRVEIWELSSRRVRHRLRGHRAQVLDLAFSPRGSALATASQDGSTRLWDVDMGEEQSVLRGHTEWVTSVAFSPDGRQIVTGSRDGQVKLWDRNRSREVLTGHEGEVWGIGFSSDGRLLLSACRSGDFRLWDVESGGELARLWDIGPSYGAAAVFSADGRWMAASGSEVKVWDARRRTGLYMLRGHTGLVSGIVFAPDGKTLITASLDSTVRLWDSATGRERACLKGHGGEIHGIGITPDGRMLATGGGSTLDRGSPGEIILWELPSGRFKARLTGHTGWVMDVAISPDGQWLASGGYDETVRLWRLPEGTAILTLRGHTSTVNGVAFSPDSRTLASGSWDDTVRLWHTVTGQELATLNSGTRGVCAVAFSPDGRTLGAAGRDHTIRLWRAEVTGHRQETSQLGGGSRRLAHSGSQPATLSVPSQQH